jgi:hypothetical protein
VQASHKKKGKKEKRKEKKGKGEDLLVRILCVFFGLFFVVVKCFLDVRQPHQSSSSAC